MLKSSKQFAQPVQSLIEITGLLRQTSCRPENRNRNLCEKLLCVQWMGEINFHTGYAPQCCDFCRVVQKNIPCFGKCALWSTYYGVPTGVKNKTPAFLRGIHASTLIFSLTSTTYLDVFSHNSVWWLVLAKKKC